MRYFIIFILSIISYLWLILFLKLVENFYNFFISNHHRFLPRSPLELSIFIFTWLISSRRERQFRKGIIFRNKLAISAFPYFAATCRILFPASSLLSQRWLLFLSYKYTSLMKPCLTKSITLVSSPSLNPRSTIGFALLCSLVNEENLQFYISVWQYLGAFALFISRCFLSCVIKRAFFCILMGMLRRYSQLFLI